jgi:putative hydrolase of the HAD superfamily
MLDKGTLNLKEAIPRAAHRCQLSEDEAGELFAETPRSLVPFPETVALLEELHEKGFNLYVLSNMHYHVFEYLSSAYDFWPLFAGIVISSHIQSIKPEPEIFDHLLRVHKLSPQNTLFLDDMAVNVAAAQQKGIATILVGEISQMRDELYGTLQSERFRSSTPEIKVKTDL